MKNIAILAVAGAVAIGGYVYFSTMRDVQTNPVAEVEITPTPEQPAENTVVGDGPAPVELPAAEVLQEAVRDVANDAAASVGNAAASAVQSVADGTATVDEAVTAVTDAATNAASSAVQSAADAASGVSDAVTNAATNAVQNATGTALDPNAAADTVNQLLNGAATATD